MDAMTAAVRAVLVPMLSGFLLMACGAGAAETAPDERVALSDRDLAKVAPELRERLDADGVEAIPVKVFFHGRPSDALLSELLLTRVGSTVIGQLSAGDVRRVVARPDVARVELLEAGYDEG